VIPSTKVRLVLCEEKQRLRAFYSQALKAHSRAVNDAVLARGTQDYDRIRALSDEARNILNAARSALEKHKQEHGC
jgi:DICT domain-containing protein